MLHSLDWNTPFYENTLKIQKGERETPAVSVAPERPWKTEDLKIRRCQMGLRVTVQGNIFLHVQSSLHGPKWFGALISSAPASWGSTTRYSKNWLWNPAIISWCPEELRQSQYAGESSEDTDHRFSRAGFLIQSKSFIANCSLNVSRLSLLKCKSHNIPENIVKSCQECQAREDRRLKATFVPCWEGMGTGDTLVWYYGLQWEEAFRYIRDLFRNQSTTNWQVSKPNSANAAGRARLSVTVGELY